ncbi:terpene synthase family protein [Kitasatospora sp. NPDC089509]|uniref:terpene synthase family protein n=1 Tax=Kitasatospora sp. NPDC089509 TaxID=3364079 RepID=UPI0037FF94C2
MTAHRKITEQTSIPTAEGSGNVPDVAVPFTAAFNTDAARPLDLHVQNWAARFGLAQAPAAAARYQAARYGSFAAWAYPELNDLPTLAEWTTWLFVFDDQFDDGALGWDPDRARTILEELAALLSTDSTPEPPTNGIAASLLDLWRRTAHRMPPPWRERFVSHFRAYLNGYYQEVLHRHDAQVPDLDHYIELRRDASASDVCLDLMEFGGGYTIRPEIYASPQYQALRTATNDITNWTNDMVSAGKEDARGDVHNIVYILRHDSDESWTACAARTQHMILSRCEDLLTAERALSTLPDSLAVTTDERAILHSNIATMKLWLAGCPRWYQDNVRYHKIEYTAPGAAPAYLEELFPPTSP